MASTKEIKRRIKSVKSTSKITKAMELVAAAKMKRAVASTLASRLYAKYSWEILTSIGDNETVKHPLFQDKKPNDSGISENILLILITSNRGLCGAYNAQIMKKILSYLKASQNKVGIDIISVGKKGDAMIRRLGKNVIASFFEIPTSVSISDIVPISLLAVNEYNSLHYDKVLVAYTDFVSALSQKPNIRQLLPISKKSLEELIEQTNPEHEMSDLVEGRVDYLFEGDKEELINLLAEKITRMQIYQMILESNASEESSRMVAMKNASEAADEMISDLTLIFNKARQSNITREISEISAGMASVK